MKCQEMMELMQRDLDQDLDHNEQLSMLAHLRQCPDCAAMYERLKRLSSELENLPMVLPSLNIVDSILPRLEQMNEVYTEHSAAQATVDLKKENKDYFSWKWVSGAVAAAVLLGGVLFNLNSKPMHNNAEVMLDSLQNGKAKSSKSIKEDQASTSQKVGGASSGADANAQGGTGNLSDSNPSVAPVPESSDSNALRLNDNFTNFEKRSENSAAPSVNQPTNDQTDNKTELKAAPAVQAPKQLAPIVREAVPQPTPTPSPIAETEKQLDRDIHKVPIRIGDQSSPMIAPRSLLAEPAEDPEKTAQQQTPVVSAAPSPLPASAERKSETTSSSAAAPLKGLSSENGEYLAVVEQQQVMIKDKNNQLVFTSALHWKLEDTVVLKNWLSADSLVYEVKAADGSIQTFCISLSQKTEIKQ